MSKPDRPKVFGVCFVKNEDDIIADSVTHAAKFCDKVFVIDNASTDQTWDIVNGLDLDNLVPVCSKDFVYRDHLYLSFMKTKKEELGVDNWWYMFGADEFIAEDPIPVIMQAEEEGADCIAVERVNFLITKDEVRDAVQNGRLETWRDRKYYVLYDSGDVRFCKNTSFADYGICDNVPFGLMKECSRRLLMKHYPYRSLSQLKKRVYTRCGNPEFESEARRGTDLECYVIDPATVPQLRQLDEEKGIDFTGGFSIILRRRGESGRDWTFAVIIRTLYRLQLLRLFYVFYRRYAAWRQKVDLKNQPEF